MLFEPADAGEYRAVRAIGSDMRLEVTTGSGLIMVFETGKPASRRIGPDSDIEYVPKTTRRERQAQGHGC